MTVSKVVFSYIQFCDTTFEFCFHQGVSVRPFNVIYHLIHDIKDQLTDKVGVLRSEDLYLWTLRRWDGLNECVV